VHTGCGKRLRERFGRGRLAVAGEGEAVLDGVDVNHLARDHLEMALFLAVPAAHVAVKPNDTGVIAGGAVGFVVSALCRCTTVSPTRSVLFRTVPAFWAVSIADDRRPQRHRRDHQAGSREPDQAATPNAGG
jgi:hypothetical protein